MVSEETNENAKIASRASDAKAIAVLVKRGDVKLENSDRMGKRFMCTGSFPVPGGLAKVDEKFLVAALVIGKGMSPASSRFPAIPASGKMP